MSLVESIRLERAVSAQSPTSGGYSGPMLSAYHKRECERLREARAASSLGALFYTPQTPIGRRVIESKAIRYEPRVRNRGH